MSSSGTKRAWQAPAAAVLSIRATAATMGPGSDAFVLRDFAFGPRAAPAAPLTEVGAAAAVRGPVSVEAHTGDRRDWEAPAVTTHSV